jgi:hypothetical protein
MDRGDCLARRRANRNRCCGNTVSVLISAAVAPGCHHCFAAAPWSEPASLHQAARKAASASMFQAGELSRITFAA